MALSVAIEFPTNVAGAQPPRTPESGYPPLGTVAPDQRTPFYEHDSSLPVGDKGERNLDVSVEHQECDKPVWAFDHAELTVLSARFGDAQMVRIPAQGCQSCGPLVIRWFHEPTGHLQFRVDVYRQLVEPDCADPRAAAGSEGRHPSQGDAG